MKEKEKKIVIYWSVRKTLTALAGLFFIPALVILFVTSILQQTLVNPTYYKNNLKSVDAYNRMINEGIPSLILKTHISNNPLTDTVAKDISTLLLQRFIDPSWIQDVADKLIDGTINYLTVKDSTVNINLTKVREYLDRASSGLLVVRGFIPTCEELKKNKDFASLCVDPTMNPDEILKDIDGIRKEIDAINIEALKIDEVVGLFNANVTMVRTFAKNLTIYFYGSLAILLFSLMWIVILQWQRISIMVRSVTFFSGIGSFITLLISLLSRQFVPVTITKGNDLIQSPVIQSILEDFMRISITGVFNQVELYAGILMVISFLFFGLSFINTKKK